MSKSVPLADEQITQLIANYNTPVPRYTSYPTALEWTPDFNGEAFFSALRAMHPEHPISVYIHLPFCENQCLYCGCNVLVSKRKDILDEYMNHLLEEIEFKLGQISFKPQLKQLHFGGGTPNFLRLSDWDNLMTHLRNRLEFEDDAEVSIELDPMYLEAGYLEHLKELGFNRVSFGIQDVNSQTLEAVNRPQDIETLRSVLQKARNSGFKSVNIDLIYGLPHQTTKTYLANLAFVKDLLPERIALFSYAHVPWLKHHQKRLNVDDMPEPSEKLKIYLMARSFFLENGYEQIGMDHFALPHDELAKALSERNLHRNFMGYTTLANLDMIAFGSSAISQVRGVFAQNHVKLKAYKESVNKISTSFEKGYVMTVDDKIRSEIIQSLMGRFFLDLREIEAKWDLKFSQYFSNEISALHQWEQGGQIQMGTEDIRVTQSGIFIVRHIAQTFDAHRKSSKVAGFSKGI